MTQQTVGLIIARARQRKGMTQREVADALGVPQPTVARWESDANYPAQYAGAIEDLLDITIPARNSLTAEAS